jgi:hypothetical protein
MTPDWKDAVRRETQSPPVGARERVWRALEAKAAPGASSLRPALPPWPWAAAAVGLAVVVAVAAAGKWSRGESRSWSTSGSVLIAERAHLDYAPTTNQVTLLRGRLSASVWGGPPLRVSVQGHLVEVEAAVLVVDAASDAVTISPVRGSIVVDGERVEATQATRAAAGTTASLEALEPPQAPSLRAARLAELALEAHRWEDAAQALGELASAPTLRAEAALVQKGAVELRQLGAPTRALATFDEAARRFPNGSLGQERELSALEAEVALAHFADARARAQRFLATYPGSERTREVRRALMTALWKLGAQAEACARAAESPGIAPSLDTACAAGATPSSLIER